MTGCRLPLGPASARPKLRALIVLIARELPSKGTVRRKPPVVVRLAVAGAAATVAVAPDGELTPAGVAIFTPDDAKVDCCPDNSAGWMGMDTDLCGSGGVCCFCCDGPFIVFVCICGAGAAKDDALGRWPTVGLVGPVRLEGCLAPDDCDVAPTVELCVRVPLVGKGGTCAGTSAATVVALDAELLKLLEVAAVRAAEPEAARVTASPVATSGRPAEPIGAANLFELETLLVRLAA